MAIGGVNVTVPIASVASKPFITWGIVSILIDEKAFNELLTLCQHYLISRIVIA